MLPWERRGGRGGDLDPGRELDLEGTNLDEPGCPIETAGGLEGSPP